MISKDKIYDYAFFLTKTLMQCILRENLDENQLNQIMEHMEIKTQEEAIFFLTQMLVNLRKYPDSLFPNPDVRFNFLNTVQESLDAKILAENN